MSRSQHAVSAAISRCSTSSNMLRTLLSHRSGLLSAVFVAAFVGAFATTPMPHAQAVPAPEVEFLYDVSVRRQYGFPNNDPIGYGHSICDRVRSGEGYAQLVGDVQGEVTPSDAAATNYLISYAVSVLCPELIWQLRQSATGYRLPPGAGAPDTYF
jgi:hypothetical protein